MQRVEPRPVDTAPQSQEQSQAQQGGQQQPQKWNLNLPAGFASTGSQAHTQSFEEIYGVPENFLEIEVRIPPRVPACCASTVSMARHC